MEMHEILNELVLVDFIVGGSTGEVTTSTDDFFREVGKMLPKGSFSWVSKWRTAIKREILKVGTARKVHGRTRGYFIPVAAAEAQAKIYVDIRASFHQDKEAFLKALPGIVDGWANAQENQVRNGDGTWRPDLIRRMAPDALAMDKLLMFEVSMTRLGATKFLGETDSLNTEVKGLAGQVATEIAEDVSKSWKGDEGGRTTSRVLGLIQRIRNKSNSMGILSPKFKDLGVMCQELLQSLPTEGPIIGADFLRVSTLLNFCLKPDQVLGLKEPGIIQDAVATDVHTSDKSLDAADSQLETASEQLTFLLPPPAPVVHASVIPSQPEKEIEEANDMFII